MKVGTRARAASRGRGRGEPSHRPNDIAGVIAAAMGLTVAVALATRDSGLVGQAAASLFSAVFGKGAWAIPPLLLVVAFGLLRGRGVAVRHLLWGLALAFSALLGLLAAKRMGDYFDPGVVSTGGGYVGALLAWSVEALVGAAKPIVFAALALVGLILCFDVPIRTLAASLGARAAVLRARAPVPAKRIEREPRRPVEAPPPPPAPEAIEPREKPRPIIREA